MDDLGRKVGDLIRRVNADEPGAQDSLFAAANGELRKLARSRLHDGGRNTVLDTTALVHESYLRFIQGGQLRSDERRRGEGEVLKVDEALDALAQSEPRLAQVVEMRYFGGSCEQEVAEALGLTDRTVRRDWDKARPVLGAMLQG